MPVLTVCIIIIIVLQRLEGSGRPSCVPSCSNCIDRRLIQTRVHLCVTASLMLFGGHPTSFCLRDSGCFFLSPERSTNCEQQGIDRESYQQATNSSLISPGEKTSGCFSPAALPHLLSAPRRLHRSRELRLLSSQVCGAARHAARCLLALSSLSPAHRFCLRPSAGCTFDSYLRLPRELLDLVDLFLSFPLSPMGSRRPTGAICLRVMEV